MDDLERRIREAAAWCDERSKSRAPPSAVLRSRELRPDGDFIMHGARLRGASAEDVCAKRSAIVDAVASRRHELLGTNDVGVPSREAGRILAFEPDASFADGVVSRETSGLFDQDDVPPWDAWIAYGRLGRSERELLLAWIPANFVPDAEIAIRIHVANAYEWMPEIIERRKTK